MGASRGRAAAVRECCGRGGPARHVADAGSSSSSNDGGEEQSNSSRKRGRSSGTAEGKKPVGSSTEEQDRVAAHRLGEQLDAKEDEERQGLQAAVELAAEEGAAAEQPSSSNGLSAYEQERLNTIGANNQKMVELGLMTEQEAAAQAALGMDVNVKPKPKRQKKEKTDEPPPRPTRGSSRLNGEAPVAGIGETGRPSPNSVLPEEQQEEEDDPLPTLKAASKDRRLTPEQMKKLDSLEEVSAAPLTDEEVEAAKKAREYVRNVDEQHKKNKGVNYVGRRASLRKCVLKDEDLRWPTWLKEIETSLPKIQQHLGLNPISEDNKIKVMYALERGACGIGIDYRDTTKGTPWPLGVGVLINNEEEGSEDYVAKRPRVLTLGADTEILKREGNRLETMHGKDKSNGWCYNHALGKLRGYQEMLLLKHFNEEPSAPSIAELEAGDEEAGRKAAGEGLAWVLGFNEPKTVEEQAAELGLTVGDFNEAYGIAFEGIF